MSIHGIDPLLIKPNPDLAPELRPLSDEEYQRLKDSIAEFHIKQPILVDGYNQIIDGHHRLKAALELKLSLVPTETQHHLSDENKHKLAISLNADRRQMTPEEIAAARQERREKAVEMREEGNSLRAIARELGVSHEQVRKDIEETGVNRLTPSGNITGLDGKSYPASRPDPDEHYETSNNSDELVVDEETGEILSPESGNGNSRRLPQTNRAGSKDEPKDYDDCQTPPYALEPLLPYLDQLVDNYFTVWEPARGDGQLVEALLDAGYGGYSGAGVVSSSIQDGQNFFDYEPPLWDCLVTNPPYSIKYDWLKRCYELGKPFALLLPVMTLGAAQAQELFAEYGVQVIFMSPRVDFKMPSLGYKGNGAQFPTAWFTWQLQLERDMLFASIKEAKKAFVDSLEEI